jgi:phosphate starvation-inducible protein PhoH and related proteins
MARETRKKKTTSTRKVTPKARHNFVVKAKTAGQREYIRSISENVVTLCSGPAGSGKTLCSIGKAMELWQKSHGKEGGYSKVVVVRPAIEACGESIGFLPGGINDKMRPLIEPVMDNLRFFIQDEGYLTSLVEPTSGRAPVIDVIPMAYLRGRTLNSCIVVFDEAQNSSIQQMKLFLTRIGHNAKVIIQGDVTQSDRFRDRTKNGLADAMSRLDGIPNVGIVTLSARDIQRSEIIAPILERYQDVDGI